MKRVISFWVVVAVLIVTVMLGGCTIKIDEKQISRTKKDYNSNDVISNGEKLDLSQKSVGDIVEFGSYPQTEVTDENLKIKLNNLINENSWVSYCYYSGEIHAGDSSVSFDEPKYTKTQMGNWMKYSDVECDGEKYRAVTFSEYRPLSTNEKISTAGEESVSFQKRSGYYVNEVYWFKYEPIKWRVLDPSKGLLLSELIIDSQPFNNTMDYFGEEPGEEDYPLKAHWTDSSHEYYLNDYAHSDIREWLNHYFYNTAFSVSQQKKIATTEIDNTNDSSIIQNNVNSDWSFFTDETTNDKVFLLSANDILNPEYGFSTEISYEENDDSEDIREEKTRTAQCTDYSRCQGLCNYDYYYEDNKIPGFLWRLRSSCSISNQTINILDYGWPTSEYSPIDTYLGIRPAITIEK